MILFICPAVYPLLGKYFYNDIESLSAIVGEGFYNNYGNIQYLSTTANDDGISEFEHKLAINDLLDGDVKKLRL